MGRLKTVTPRAIADQYVREVLPAYQLDSEMAVNLADPITDEITEEGPRLKIVAEKILGPTGYDLLRPNLSWAARLGSRVDRSTAGKPRPRDGFPKLDSSRAGSGAPQ